jgi:hypothetical protein
MISILNYVLDHRSHEQYLSKGTQLFVRGQHPSLNRKHVQDYLKYRNCRIEKYL